MFSPIIGMIHNTKLNRWHPVVFQEKPLPGPPSADKPVRHKSVMHHTTGFPSRAEALENIDADLMPQVKSSAIGEVQTSLDKDFPWDGEDIPAMVTFFAKVEGKLVPAV